MNGVLDFMHFILENLYELVNKKEYDKIFKTATFIFAFLAPSISYVFIFHNNLFMSLDIIKLLLICIVVNLTFIAILFLILLSLNEQKQAGKTINSVEVTGENKNIDDIKYTFYETVLHAINYTAVLWIFCLTNKMLNSNINERIYLTIILSFIAIYVIVTKIQIKKMMKKNDK